MADIVSVQAELPSPAIIDLSRFGGRILPAKSVHSGTFYISTPLEKICGEDAIASYIMHKNNDGHTWVSIEAWMPDAKTPGVFQRGDMRKTDMELWGNPYLRIKDVSLENGVISISAKKIMSVSDVIALHILGVLVPPVVVLFFLSLAAGGCDATGNFLSNPLTFLKSKLSAD